MGEKQSPRDQVKAMLKGEAPETPLLMPIVFSIGSRLEHVSAGEFAKNPTKIVNALRQIRSTLKVDAVCCYFDASLETVAVEEAGLRPGDSPIHAILSKGCVPVAIDVLKRAKTMLRDAPALMVRVTGPLTIASQLVHLKDSPEWSDRELVEFSADVCATLAKAYLDAGADVILLVETVLALPTPELVDWWGSLLEPIANVVRFYEALPVLVLRGEGLSLDLACMITERAWGFVLCPDVAVLSSNPWKGGTAGVGLASAAEVLGRSSDSASVQQLVGDAKPLLLTTLDDIPVTADLKHLAATLQQLRGTLAAQT